jgi:type II secretory pathway component PulK
MTLCSTNRIERRGAALIVVLVMLTVIFAIAGIMLRHIALQQRSARDQQRKLQAQWLAESALDRAIAKLADDPKYAGEKWQPEWSSGVTEQTGQAQIEVKTMPDASNFEIQVTAEHPVHPVYRAQVVLRRSIPIPRSTN